MISFGECSSARLSTSSKSICASSFRSPRLRRRCAVGQVPAGGQRQPHNGIAGLQQGHHHSAVGLAAGMGLDVDEGTAEQVLGAFDGQGLGDIDEFTAAVIAPSGIALGVFVGHDAALGLHDGARNDVFRRDQFDLVLLAPQFVVDGLLQVRVDVGEGGLEKAFQVLAGVFHGRGR